MHKTHQTSWWALFVLPMITGVGARGFEPPTSRTRTNTAHHARRVPTGLGFFSPCALPALYP